MLYTIKEIFYYKSKFIFRIIIGTNFKPLRRGKGFIWIYFDKKKQLLCEINPYRLYLVATTGTKSKRICSKTGILQHSYLSLNWKKEKS